MECTAEDCTNEQRGQGPYCNKHYMQIYRHGCLDIVDSSTCMAKDCERKTYIKGR